MKHETKNSNVNNQWKTIRWRAKTIRIDAATGELITKFQSENDYIKISVAKDYEISKHAPEGTITYIITFRRNPQLRLI